MVSYDALTDEQQRAVDALDRNVTLTAGAGTGKTTTLTARYLAMFERSLQDHLDGSSDDGAGDGDAHLLPENVLTTTFTERAANDLEASIRGEITNRFESLDVEEFEAWRTVADELEHGYIHTLHEFCARLLREHALTIEQVDPGFDTLDEDDTTALIEDTVGAVLEEYENHDATRTLARQFSRSQLHDILVDLLGERPESLDWADRWADADEDEYIEFVEAELHPIDPEDAAQRLADEAFVQAVETLTAIVEDPPDIDTGGTAWQRAVGVVEILEPGFDDGVPSRSKQTTIAELSMHLTTGSGERYASYSGATSRWGDHPRKEEFDAAFETIVEVIQPEAHAVNVDPELERNSFPFVTALAELTQIAAVEYQDRKDRQNVVDFTDQITYAVEFLTADANAAIREQLREQFEYVMVDEFQDTDPRQWDLIKLLTAGASDTFDAENVFVVGDVKQSIYRFRNADVTQFQETAHTLEHVGATSDIAGEDSATDGDQLSTNFRTLPTVLETINELFESVFDVDGEPYEAAPQSLTADRRDPAGVGRVEYLAVPTDPELRARRFDHYQAFAETIPEHDAELEAMALAARLSQILAEPYQVYPEDDEDNADIATSSDTGSESSTGDGKKESPPAPRDIEPSDIAILIRSRTHLKEYERALEDENIPYSVASGIGFYESPEITALLNLFRALADPSDERALYAVLRSPLFGLTDDTLAELKLHGDSLWEALAASDHDELTPVYEYLTEWRQIAGLGDDGSAGFDGSWAAYLTRILEDTGYLVNVSADERPQQAMANVEKFREQLRGWTEDGIRSLTTLVNRIERRIELGGRESEADTTGEGVQILTIHDSKGMEFPFVVVPGIGRGFNDEAAIGSGQVEFERIGDHHAVGMKAPSVNDPFEMEDTIARETIRERRRDEEHAEEKRVLYVACTRARDHLLLTGRHEADSDAEEPTLTELEAAEPGSASSWRDWVQPELLSEEICATLTETTRVQQEYGDGAYTVSIPTPPVDRDQPSPDTDPTVALSPSPPQPDPSFRLSATDLAAYLGGYGELAYNEATNTVSVADREDERAASPDARHGEATPGVHDGDTAGQATGDTDAVEDGIDPMVFGEMVHRICELRPPDEKWSNLMQQTLVDQDAETTLTPELQTRVGKHAQRGIDYVDAQTDGVTVTHQYDELYVTAEFDQGEIAGFIDHLLVTPDTYHIIDYKTGDITPDEMAEDAEYYANQMKAYAVALHQQETDRSVCVSLVFTAIDEAWEIEWTPEEIESIQTDIVSELTAYFPTA